MAKVIYPRDKSKSPYLVITWNIEDVHQEAHDHNLECTDEQAIAVLENAAKGHDAEKFWGCIKQTDNPKQKQ